MKKGLDIRALAEKVYEQSQQNKDYVAASTQLAMQEDTSIKINGQGIFSINNVAHRQIAERLQIPAKYYDRMKVDAPELLAVNVNKWFEKQPEKRLLRTRLASQESPYLRAFLSDRYRPFDNDLILESALPVLLQHQNLEVLSSEVTETRLYVQAINRSLKAEVRKGDIVHGGITLSNSEVGLGSVSATTMIYRCYCDNGAIRPEGMKRYHTGKRLNDGQDVGIFYNTDTVIADNKAFGLKIRDMMLFAFEEAKFLAAVDFMKSAAERYLTGKVEGVIEVLSNRFSLNGGEQESILRNFINGGDCTQYGLGNAITSIANDPSDTLSFDRAIELQKVGGEVFEMTWSQWAAMQ